MQRLEQTGTRPVTTWVMFVREDKASKKLCKKLILCFFPITRRKIRARVENNHRFYNVLCIEPLQVNNTRMDNRVVSVTFRNGGDYNQGMKRKPPLDRHNGRNNIDNVPSI